MNRNAWIVALALLICTLSAAPSSAITRDYWLKAEEILWDYAPSFPTNLMTGLPFTPEQRVFVEPGPDRIGHIYKKAVYRSYTTNFGRVLDGPNEVLNPATGAMRILRPAGSSTEHLGLLGPILRAEVGDTIVVHFKNTTAFPVSIHPHGVFYLKNSEGTPYEDGTSGADKADDAVPTGGQVTYTWGVPDRSGPGPNDPDSILWEYHSHTHEVADPNSGLIGAMIIYKAGKLANRTPNREFVNLFNIYNENVSNYLDDNIAQFTTVPVDPEDEGFQESNLMHTINGLVYGNLMGLTMRRGELVRWYIFGMGTEVDLHSPHWHGATLLHNGNRIDVTEVIPAVAKTMDMRPDDVGQWMYHCHVNDHIEAGMMAMFTVNP